MAKGYIPPLRFDGLTRLYDPLLAVLLREKIWRPQLVEQVALQPGMRVLDLGCGTGMLTVALARSCAGVEVVGLDADHEALRRARTKAAAAGVAIQFVEGRAEEASLAPSSFDRVVSSLFFHHLTTDAKRRVLERARLLLTPDGELHLADWGEPHDALMRIAFLPVQLLDGPSTRDNLSGDLEWLIAAAGFVLTQTQRRRTVFGTLSFWRGDLAAA